ncbi:MULTISPECIES: hypothetical protein [unclassified Asaia]|uniref:hypothetical protein n=1 Tax=unclassified Asaia TaxID=2685023 RepID=UPI00131504CF|nr:hypothetical protein [Asaia sp. W19]
MKNPRPVPQMPIAYRGTLLRRDNVRKDRQKAVVKAPPFAFMVCARLKGLARAPT